MAFDPLSTEGKAADDAPLPRRLIWMLAYWAMGVLVVGAVGFFIRFWIKT
ncbi:MAG: DUF2474 domain-containing protein [Sphingomonadales bacterium]|nr:DUF2474 domain-containing protein [Sphingomonadales bacterium]PIX66636.1 MAG: DUF2474 domain-containing protein [Sphingomonadales bacterium CG_4_10_14_3_um_filter_58_15]NCO49801.1 DUF2474 domain-containing protein [Sphingomonadales bacterium]NCP01629.1 DUF2474 domain-containing protein [Sphingomonadales bacterium]NCP27587.1 DUF2474 domain-containing protein [Sphingomonadales bacterium]